MIKKGANMEIIQTPNLLNYSNYSEYSYKYTIVYAFIRTQLKTYINTINYMQIPWNIYPIIGVTVI